MIRTYTEILRFEEAFKSFLSQLNRKPVIEIKHYVLYSRTRANHYSWIGYETNTRGLHGIHFNSTINEYYFGTRNNKIKSEIWMVMPPKAMLIPSHLKAGLSYAAKNEVDIKTKNVKKRG
jgi:hypothetical protein